MKQRQLVWNGPRISAWRQYQRRIKRPGRVLLSHLERFPDAILVAGCQRSGTTALTRLLGAAPGMADFRFGPDDELDAALMLCGYVEQPVVGRCCFQTTYLNDQYQEYFQHQGFRLIWVLREPFSVVYSMLFNWRRGALRRLYETCGHSALAEDQSSGWFGPTRFEKACACYVAKTSQTEALVEGLSSEQLLVVDYDQLVKRKQTLLEGIFDFVQLPYSGHEADGLHAASIAKGERFSADRKRHIEQICVPSYRRALEFLSL